MIEGRASVDRSTDTSGQRGVRTDQTEHADADQADLDARAERDRTHHRGVDREERPDAQQQRRLVVRPELLDREVLHGDRDVVDHTIADVEDRALPVAVQSGHEFRGAERDHRGGQARQRTERGR